jgi:hypothetical protein
MNSIRTFVKRYPLFTFFAIAYLFAWLGWTMPDRIYTGTPISTVFTLFFIALVPGPLWAALIVTAITSGKSGLITHAADGLIRAGFTGEDLNRFYIFYVAGWWVVVLGILLIYGPNLVRKPTILPTGEAIGQLAPVK